MASAERIELPPMDLETMTLPLRHALIILVSTPGFEPRQSRSQSERPTSLAYVL